MAGLQGGSQAQRVPSVSKAADPPSLVSQVDRLEAQLAALSAAVGGRVAGAQQETREHLALFEGAVQELEVGPLQMSVWGRVNHTLLQQWLPVAPALLRPPPPRSKPPQPAALRTAGVGAGCGGAAGRAAGGSQAAGQ